MTLEAGVAGAPIDVNISLPTTEQSGVWALSGTLQQFDAVTGGRSDDPVFLGKSTFPLVTLNGDDGFATSGTIANTPGQTEGISYTLTRTSPTPATCTNTGFWTNPDNNPNWGPTPENPTGRPDTAPALIGNNHAAAGTNDVQLGFDQEMLASGQGLPAPGAFTVTVGGVARTVSAVAISNDITPPLQVTLDLTLSGDALTAGATVAVSYQQPASSSDPALQDLENLETPSFGPISIPVS